MKKIKDVCFVFVCVTTCVVFATAIYTTVFWNGADLNSNILWEILLVSFLCSLGGFMYPERAVSKNVLRLLILLHYLEVNAVVLGFGILFEWFYADNLGMVLGMVALIAGIFLLVSFISWKRGEKLAKRMNERLKEYQRAGQED